MAGVRSERVAMSPQDEGARDRRLGRAYKDGVPMQAMVRMFGMSEGTITQRVKDKFPHIPIRGAKGSRRRSL